VQAAASKLGSGADSRCSPGGAHVPLEWIEEVKSNHQTLLRVLQPYAEQKRQATRVSLAEGGASGGELKSRAGREMGGEALGAKRF
jgi:hypothetical protein